VDIRVYPSLVIREHFLGVASPHALPLECSELSEIIGLMPALSGIFFGRLPMEVFSVRMAASMSTRVRVGNINRPHSRLHNISSAQFRP
jgi:hypothetical protein